MGTVAKPMSTWSGLRARRWFVPARDWPYLPVVIAPLVLFAPFLVGARALYWGTPLLQFYPWRQAALAAVRAGEWPLWNPLVGNGAPLLANYQSALLYPPNWLALIMPLALSFGWLGALHLILAGVGMVTLARSLGLRPLGQAMAGLAFGLSQYLVARVGFLSINAAVAWLPWVVWAVEQQTRLSAAAEARERLRPALALAASVGLLLLAGHAQTAWYVLLLAGAWALWRLLGPVVLGAGLAAAQLLPTAELMQVSPRAASADYDFVVTYSFSPWRLLTLLAPDLLGNPARGRYYGYGNYWEDAVYAGVVPLLLALNVLFGAFIGRLRRVRGAAREATPTAGLPLFLGVTLLVCVVLALGSNTGVFPFFYNHVPTFNLFQAPARMLIGLVFALALLAGLGADRWQPPRDRALYWTRLGTAGAVAFGLVGVAALVGLPNTGPVAAQLKTVARALALAGLGLFVAGAFSLLLGTLVVSARAWTGGVVAFVALDLIFVGYGLNPGAPPALYSQPSSIAVALAPHLDGRRLFYYPLEEQSVKFKRLLSFEIFGTPAQALATRAVLLPNTAGMDGLASANNFDPLVSARYARLLEAVEATQSPALLRLMNVAVLASSAPRGWPLLAEVQDVGVQFYQVPGQSERAWVTHNAYVAADGDAALAQVALPGFDPATTVVLEAGETDLSLPETAGIVNIETVTLTSAFNTVTVRAALIRPGWVVLADTHYPGWVARVDGVTVPLLHANYAFRAVAVGAGEHTVEFLYRPGMFQAGLWLSLGSLAVLAGAAIYLARSRAPALNA